MSSILQARPLGLDWASVAPQDPASELIKAGSITVLVHGIGVTTTEKILSAASKGYADSGFGEEADSFILPSCPSLTGKSGADCLSLVSSGRSHVLIALPWSKLRARLSAIAKWTAIVLLGFVALISVTFPFRDLLDTYLKWISTPWWHFVEAYLVLSGLSFLVWVIEPTPNKGEFQGPDTGILALPIFLQLGLMCFMSGNWLWVPIGLLLVALWLMVIVTALRCFRITSTLRWRLALIALIVAIAFPGVAMLHFAQRASVSTSKHAESVPIDSYGANAGPPRDFGKAAQLPPSNKTAEDYFDSPPKATKKSGAQVHPHHSIRSRKKVVAGSAMSPSGVLDPYHHLASPWNPGAVAYGSLHLEKPLRFGELYPPSEFTPRLILALICVVICILTSAFGWLLDFAMDVLHFCGNEHDRVSLISRTADAIRWLHEKSPDALIIVVGHSLGSAIASHAIHSIPASDPCLKQIRLVTLGSPLNYLAAAFPGSVKSARELSRDMGGRVPWINLWRPLDIVGKALKLESALAVQYCTGRGGHIGYWSDGAVWRAIAKETFLKPDHVEVQKPVTLQLSIMERFLGFLVFVAIVVLSSCGFALWNAAK